MRENNRAEVCLYIALTANRWDYKCRRINSNTIEIFYIDKERYFEPACSVYIPFKVFDTYIEIKNE